MREIDTIKIVVALCLASTGTLLPSAAQSDDKDTLVQYLVDDIKIYVQECGPVKPNTHPASQKCANEQAQLVRRQVELHLSNADVNAKLSGRGPGGWHPEVP